MDAIMDLITSNLVEIVGTVLAAVLSYVGVQIKKVYTKYVNTKTKKEIVKATVEYVEQVYNSSEVKLAAEEKFMKAKFKAQEWLSSLGITISDTEIEILIESAVNALNKGLKGE